MTHSPNHDFYEGVHVNGFGFRMLTKMGWQKGKGLGSKEQGLAKHVKVTKKFDTVGIGAKYQVDWTASTSSYNAILARLNVAFAENPHSTKEAAEKLETLMSEAEDEIEHRLEKKMKKLRKKKEKKSEDEDEEEEEETSFDRERLRKKDKKKKKKDKKKNKNKEEENEEEDSSSSEKKKKKKRKRRSKGTSEEEKESDDEEEDEEENDEEHVENHRAKKLMRFSFRRRIHSKNVAHYSTKDLKNILYEAHHSDNEEKQEEQERKKTKKSKKNKKVDTTTDEDENDATAKKKERKEEKKKRRKEEKEEKEKEKDKEEQHKHKKHPHHHLHHHISYGRGYTFGLLPRGWKPEPLRSEVLKRVFVKHDDTEEEDNTNNNNHHNSTKNDNNSNMVVDLNEGLGFTEEQQEAIALAAEKAKNEGKKGLGFSTISKLGKDFAGSKTKF